MKYITLRIIKTILVTCEDSTSESLCDRYKLSDRQLKRHIVEARSYGADIQSIKVDGRYVWTCHNENAILQAGKLRTALELATATTLL